jgi:hypothetical protein
MIERNLDIPEYRQCKICDTYLVKDFLGEYYCPECEKEVVDNVKLKPCPFCGKTEVFLGEPLNPDEYGVMCNSCGAVSGLDEDGNFAEQLYNTRPIEDALNKRIAELEAQQPRWIPVSERLPELPNWVIAYNPISNSGDPCPAFYRDGKWYFELGEEWDMNKPTHWRPLPAPPEVPE